MKLDLYYLSGSGCDWLNQTYEVESVETALETTKKYVETYKNDAKSLTKRWLSDGESYDSAELGSCSSCDDKTVENAVNNYLDSLDEV